MDRHLRRSITWFYLGLFALQVTAMLLATVVVAAIVYALLWLGTKVL